MFFMDRGNYKNKFGGGRNVSLDLLRILAMMMVLVLHANLSGGFLRVEEQGLFKFFICLYEHFAIIAVNLFVIISAWFLRTKEASIFKVISLICTIVFWTVLTSFLAVLLGESLSQKDVMNAIPVLGRNYDFCSGYIVMYLCSPYLNKMLNNITNRQLSLLAIGAFLLFSVLTPIESSHYLSVGGGYSFMWFIMLYIFTAWIKTYERIFSPIKLLMIYLICCIVGAVADYYKTPPVLGGLGYNHPIVVISAFCMFLFFYQIRISNRFAVKTILFFAPLSFGVFLIHANPVLVRWYEQFQFCNMIERNVGVYMIGMPLFVVVLFALCAMLEWCRIRFFSFLKETQKKIFNAKTS